MNGYFSLTTVFVSGLFALLVAGVTGFLTSRSSSLGHKRDVTRSRYNEIKTLYAERLASLEKCIRQTTRLEAFDELYKEFPMQNALLMLLSTPEINEQSIVVGDLLQEWSSEFRQGAPKKLGETGIVTIASYDFPHQEKAKELYPKLMDEIEKFTKLMKAHMNEIQV